jgi:hypothetical protein
MDYDDFLTVQQASLHPTKFGMPRIAVGTLNKWRVVGGDTPPFMRFGRRIVYPRQAYEDWLGKRLTNQVRSTSEFARDVSW